MDSSRRRCYQEFWNSLGCTANRLDPGGPALAAQDFRHLAQQHGETVADFIHRLEVWSVWEREIVGGDERYPTIWSTTRSQV